MNMFLTRRGLLFRYSLLLLVFLSTSTSTQALTCVSQSSNGVCPQDHFFNSTQSCCVQCQDCINQDVFTPCNRTHDAVCVPLCPSLKRWSMKDRKCVISDCSLCPGGDCVVGLEACLCNDPCYSGDTCSIFNRECRDEPQPSVKTNEGDTSSSSLNPLSIGLIAIGVVIGIVAFSSCFLLFGLCTTKQRRITESQGSENSESGLVTARGFTNSTRSSYMSGMSSTTAYLNNQSMLELLRHSNTPIHSLSGSSSNRSSPKSFRSSPKLVRTSPLAPEKFRESGLITSV